MENIHQVETKQIEEVASYKIQCFQEIPRQTGEEKILVRLEAFDLFNLFTADIIRSKKVFTR